MSYIDRHVLERVKDVRALVVGDAILDVYHFGRVDRISPEAPVPIFIEEIGKMETRRGGADNVAHQLEALGCDVVTHISNMPSVKHRYVVGHHQVFRMDYDSDEFGEAISYPLNGFNVVILSDYAKGFLTHNVCQDIIKKANQARIPVVVDPKGTEWSKYEGANIICPNEKEWRAVEFIEPPGVDMVIKYGDKGLGVRYAGVNAQQLIPAKAHQVFDVTGAGDTVVAVLAACVGAGTGLEEAAMVANAAAGYVVGKMGTSVCPVEKLSELL